MAPSIAFPESHDTPRLAAETNGSARESRFRYLFAAVFSTGVMMPIGYELGFTRPLHVVETTPYDWDAGLADSTFDISAYIGRVNAMKAATPVLNVEGRQQRVTDPDAPLVGLLRRSRRGPQRSLVLINPDRSQTERLDTAAIAEWLDSAPDDIREITPEKPANKPAQNHARGSGARAAANWHEADEVRVSPRDIRVFVRAARPGADAV